MLLCGWVLMDCMARSQLHTNLRQRRQSPGVPRCPPRSIYVSGRAVFALPEGSGCGPNFCRRLADVTSCFCRRWPKFLPETTVKYGDGYNPHPPLWSQKGHDIWSKKKKNDLKPAVWAALGPYSQQLPPQPTQKLAPPMPLACALPCYAAAGTQHQCCRLDHMCKACSCGTTFLGLALSHYGPLVFVDQSQKSPPPPCGPRLFKWRHNYIHPFRGSSTCGCPPVGLGGEGGERWGARSCRH